MTTPDILKNLTSCAIYMIKNMCIDTEAEKAELEQDITHQGKSIGRFRVTIEKIK